MFPLLNALSSAPEWLLWNRRDSVESAAAWAATSLAIALTLAIATRSTRRIMRDLVYSTWLLIGAFFVAGALVKVSLLTTYLAPYRDSGGWVVAGLGAVLIALAVSLLVFPGGDRFTRIQRIPLLMWPLVPLFLFYLIEAPSMAANRTLAVSPAPVAAQAPIPVSPVGVGRGRTGARTVILLFDELSPDYLYGTRKIDLSKLPALRQMQERGEVHSGAHLRGGATLIAIPALFSATAAAPLGLVPTLAAEGRSVRVWGWYHDYCAGMARRADSCRSNSVYNSRTLHDGFSIVDPWWTNLNLLPAAFPFNVLKYPPAVALQRRTLAATSQWLDMQLGDATADVIYAHVNVPHLPLVTEHIGSLRVPDAFTMSEEGYISQFSAVNAIVGQVLASTTRPTQLIVLSDHNARSLFPKSVHEHVVFIRLRTWVQGSPEVPSSEDAAELVGRMTLRPDAE